MESWFFIQDKYFIFLLRNPMEEFKIQKVKMKI